MEEYAQDTVSVDEGAVLQVVDEREDDDVDDAREQGDDHVEEEGGVHGVGNLDAVVHLNRSDEKEKDVQDAWKTF